MPTYHIKNATEFIDGSIVQHFNQWDKKLQKTEQWIPKPSSNPITISITSGASCPDALVDDVILKIVSLFENTKSIEEAMMPFQEK